jgi:hypothetical protein
MIVRKIALNGWRNYEFAAAEFSPGTNVITGENALPRMMPARVAKSIPLSHEKILASSSAKVF